MTKLVKNTTEKVAKSTKAKSTIKSEKVDSDNNIFENAAPVNDEAKEPKPEAKEPKPEAKEPNPEAKEPKPEAKEPKPEENHSVPPFIGALFGAIDAMIAKKEEENHTPTEAELTYEHDVKILKLLNKIQKVSIDVPNIEKGIKVSVGRSGQSYNAVASKDVIIAVSKSEAKNRLMSLPSYEIEKAEVVNKDGGYISYVDLIKVTLRVYDLDQAGVHMDFYSWGRGIDSQDKSIGKGNTYALKIALMNVYKIAGGDDLDEKASVPEKYIQKKDSVAKVLHQGKILTPQAAVKEVIKTKANTATTATTANPNEAKRNQVINAILARNGYADKLLDFFHKGSLDELSDSELNSVASRMNQPKK